MTVKGVCQILFYDDSASAEIQEYTGRFHLLESVGIDQVLGKLIERRMNGDDVR